MTRNNTIILAVALIALVLVYWNLYKDAFHKKAIQISYSMRTANMAGKRHKPAAANGNVEDEPDMTVNFGLDQNYKLTCVKVIPQEALASNKYAEPIWCIVSDSNSPPEAAFIYGGRIRGMHPSVKGAEPESLKMGVPYHIFVEAGKLRGETIFTLGDTPSAAPAPEASGN